MHAQSVAWGEMNRRARVERVRSVRICISAFGVTGKPGTVGSPRLQCSGTSVAMFSQVLSILPALPNIEGVS